MQFCSFRLIKSHLLNLHLQLDLIADLLLKEDGEFRLAVMGCLVLEGHKSQLLYQLTYLRPITCMLMLKMFNLSNVRSDH